ncbi:hypothetical protein Pla123a_16680 [Posidoniimonas polymericola]|uniref:Biotin-protein ligase N-terminal domain-containing protein n=1 Tax=Posidoniimonas polymericola TaxID=2528002 RepID=A0A5C5YSX6_9BACT|nr:BPL-N domain-containing protein [Posidoniimonas polymericola]TWT77870.1 hypothetical protein Pla123a_16680 [Posidoniimonas polymericola]
MSHRQRVITCWAALLTSSLLAPTCLAEEAIRVAVFQGSGVGKSAPSVLRALRSEHDPASPDGINVGPIEAERITAAQINAGGLDDFDVLVHPGGSASGQAKALGEDGRARVRAFVEGGGGYLGVCAGAYLATNDYSWSLGLIDAKVVDRRHWARGKGEVTLKLSPAAAEFFAAPSGELQLRYAQGPLLGRREWDDPAVPNYESLALFDTEIAKNGAPKGVMAGTSAIVRAEHGAGRVFCYSPHPELTKGRDAMIPRAVEWLAGQAD